MTLQLNNLGLAVSLAKRGNLPGAEDLVMISVDLFSFIRNFLTVGTLIVVVGNPSLHDIREGKKKGGGGQRLVTVLMELNPFNCRLPK